MRIASMMHNLFEDVEYTEPARAFRARGHEVVTVGLKKGDRITGFTGAETVTLERSFTEAAREHFDALLIPGGYSPEWLRGYDDAIDFVKSFLTAGKPIFAICHGPQLLLSAGYYKGKRMTAWKTVQGDLAKAGAIVVDEPVVVEGNVVTSRMPEDLPTFIPECLEFLARAEKAQAATTQR
jgi:protease I